MKAATAACSCLTVVPNVAPPHLAEPRRDPSLAAFPKVTHITRNASDFPFATNLRTAEHALVRPIFAAPASGRVGSSGPVGQRSVDLGSATLIDAAIGFETSVRTRETVHLLPALTLDAPAMERRSGSASEPAMAVAKHAINRSGTVTGTAAAGPDAMHDAVKTDPAACLACQPLSTEFDMFYLARASGDKHREPVTMRIAEVPDVSDSAQPVSHAQRPADTIVDTIVADREARSMDEPDLPLSPTGAQVQSLQQALSTTYQTNPTLMARRAELRGLDNAVAVERAAGNPQISAASTFNQEVHTTRLLGSRGRNLRSNVDFSKILFAGGRIRNATRSAQARVMAGRADLRATEGNILTEAVAAYADVLRDREIRDLNESQVRILLANLESTRDRFRVRDLTLTDVAQSETRLEVAQSNLVTAEGRLQASEENFERIVGARAGKLEPLPPLPPLPLSSELAAESAMANNASIAAFAARARAADYDVAVSRASRLPTLSVVSTVDNVNALGTADKTAGVAPGTLPNSETNILAGFTVRIPLYQGGAAGARIRQNEEIRSQFIEEAIAVERLVLADTRSSFSIWRSATSAILYNEQAVVSSEKALESVKFEQTVGARSILDVLNAEQEFLNSKIALTSARRDAYVAAFELLNSMGASEAADLNFAADPLYDPKANYRENSDTWSDWKDGSRRPPASTRNVPPETDSPLTRLNNGTLGEIESDD